MSKFIDKLNQLSRGESQPIGFTAKQAASGKPKIQLVASLAAEESESLAGRLAGADAALLSISRLADGAEILQKLSKSLSDIIWGVRLESGNPEEIKQLARAGADFFVFPAETTPVTAMKNNKEAGKILEVRASINDGLLRTVNDLPVDAVLIAGFSQKVQPEGEERAGQALTLQHLMLFQRFASLLTKPLLVAVPGEVTAVELEALWEAGVTAVALEISLEQPADRLASLRQEIDKIEFPRRAKRPEVLAPRIGLQPGRARREEEEEEEEDE